VATYSEAEREALKLLRHSFSWSVSMDRRSQVWVATYAGEHVKGDTPLGLFDALTLEARVRRDDYLLRGDRERTDTERYQAALGRDGYRHLPVRPGQSRPDGNPDDRG
jgi:hypothetical protein